MTGKYTRNNTADGRLTRIKPEVLEKADWNQLEAFSAFAAARHLTELQVAFSWLAQQKPVASVIAGATSAQQVSANAQAICYTFSDADLIELNEIFPAPEKIALF